VAGLDWQDLSSKIDYQANINQADVKELAANLRIIYEEEKNPELNEAHELINKAERIFFLGFGYAKENLNILGIPDVLRKGQAIYGTSLGLTEREAADVRSNFDIYAARLNLQKLDCRRLLSEYL